MKSIVSILMIVLFQLILIGCNTNNSQTPDLEEIDLESLAHYEYLDDANPVIYITVKDFGVMVAQLFPSVAENTVNNFIDYILEGQYDGRLFHRIIQGFMIQGGMVEHTNKPIRGQFSSNGFSNPLRHTKGVLSMARTSNVNSATSQFFVMHQVSPHLDGQYASFGGLISGFNVLDLIAAVPTSGSDAPISQVIIESMTIELNGYEPAAVIYFNP